jgi:hypothetical protein
MNTKPTLAYIGNDALAMIDAAREAVSLCTEPEEVFFLAEQLDIAVSRDVEVKHAKLIIFCNLVVMEKNTITFFQLG